MDDYRNLKNPDKFNEQYGSLKATLEMLSVTEASDRPTKEQYAKLVEKFEQAMQVIEIQKAKLDDLQANTLPTKDEVESMSAMLDVLNKLDIKTLDKLSTLGSQGSDDA